MSLLKQALFASQISSVSPANDFILMFQLHSENCSSFLFCTLAVVSQFNWN